MISRLFKMMFFENDTLSYTRVVSLTLILLLIFVTLYLVFYDISWSHYDTLASIAGGGGTVTQVANKFINSKYNSPAGSYTPKDDSK